MKILDTKKLVLGLVVLKTAGFSYSQEARPNIIFLLSDDQRDNTFSAMGNSIVKTPETDALIKDGVWFTNTYIAEPVCSPSRTSLLTGMHERMHGVGFSSTYQLTEEQWEDTYPAILRKNGYFTGFIGKFGVEYYTFRGETDTKFDYWSCEPYHDAEDEIITPIMGEGIAHFLDTLPINKPFCLSVSFNVPHGSQVTSMYTGYEDWFKMTRPANENPKLVGHPFYDSLYRKRDLNITTDVESNPYQYIPKHILNQDSGRRATYIYDYNEKTNREHHVRYYQTITGMDAVIGDMIKELKSRGLYENTIIIFASDHGLLMGEYGMGGKSLLYDLTSKIPCFIHDPRLPENRRGIKIDKLVSSLDIPATILDYAGIPAPPEMTGRSLIPLTRGTGEHWRTELFLESLFTLRGNPICEGIRDGDWKYVRMFECVNPYDEKDLDFKNRKPDFEQLFYLHDDPVEKTNLIFKDEFRVVADSLRQKTMNYSIRMNSDREKYKETHKVSAR